MKAQRFRLVLPYSKPQTRWPPGFELRPFDPATDAPAVHRLLVEGYANGGGAVADYAAWRNSLLLDEEFDAELVFMLFDPQGQLAAVTICWTSAFIKDLVVSQLHRRRGLASGLMQYAFASLAERGARHVDLKVHSDNVAAISLYRRLGMEPTD